MSEKEKQILRPDFCVIGAGSGGLSFAAGAVQMGASVVLVERNKMGGDCLNSGCVPSKAILAVAKIGSEIKLSSSFGWLVDKPKIDFKKVHDYVHSVINSIAPNDSVERFEKFGVKVVLEDGAFVDQRTLETKTHFIKPKRFIIATGGYPFVPPIPGLDSVKFYTNENIFDLQELPEHLAIIGGGPIGIEMAQAFNRLGSRVTVIDASLALPKDELEMTSKLKEILIAEGVNINEYFKISAINQIGADVQIVCKDAEEKEIKVNASHVLVATGRRPSIDKLNLEAAKIDFTPRGIEVDERMRTSNRRAYAIGDCAGGYQFTHVAGYQASLAIKNSIFKLRSKFEIRAIPWVTYTDPELAHVGFLEAQLKEKNIAYRKLEMNFKENDRAWAENRTEGMIKVLVSPKGRILGVTILSIHAGELIYPWVMAIQNKLKISAIVNSIAPYPTLNDINKRIAGSFYADKIFSQFMQKVVKFIMRWTR